MGEVNSLQLLTVYPNPVNDVLYISGVEDELYDLTLSDISGRKVLEGKSSNSLDVSGLAAGTYFLGISTTLKKGGRWDVVKKVIVK